MPFDHILFDIAKRSPETERLLRLLDSAESATKKAFVAFTNRISDEKLIKAMADLIQHGQMTQALAIIETEGATLGTAANAVFLGAAQSEATAFLSQLRRIAPTKAISFNQFDTNLAAIASQTGVDFVRQTTQSQKDAIVSALSNGFGGDVRTTARRIKSAIGLTQKQMATVDRYRQLLQQGSQQALTYALRDKRFDSSVASGQILSPEKIEAMVGRYRQRYVAHRATVIARTEGGHLSSLAREVGFRHMIGQAGIQPWQCDHTWNTRKDDKVRDPEHVGLEGQTVPLTVQFTAPDGTRMWRPLDPSAPAHQRISCRCFQHFRIRENAA